MDPLISIVIPTYNRLDDLKECLESVFSQSYQNFEILLVGDKCPVLNHFVEIYPKSKDKRFKWYNLEINGGPGGHAPRNHALQNMCNSEWVAYLDDDNTWDKDHLQTFVDIINNEKDVSVIVNSMKINNKILVFDDLRRGRIDTSCVCHKYDLLKTYGFWKSRIEAGYAHDFEFFSRFRNEKIFWTKKATLNYSTKYNCQTWDNLIAL